MTRVNVRPWPAPALLVLVLASTACTGPTPKPVPPAPATVVFYADGKTVLPDGPARRRVQAELAALRNQSSSAVEAGYQVVSTIEQPLQRALEVAAALPGQPADLQAAAVVVQPTTGRVAAYYGGAPDATVDFAGLAHPPGQSFAAYDLAEALRQGISPQSRWKAPGAMEFPRSGRGGGSPVVDTSRCPNNAAACTLVDAVTGGLIIPLYALTERLGVAKILELARAAGIDRMQTVVDGRPTAIDLRAGADPATLFSTEVGIGQYGITVSDHANGMATFAAGGRRAAVHLIASVSLQGKQVHREAAGTKALDLTTSQVDNLTWTLMQQPAGRLADGRRTAAVTGTWRLGAAPDRYAHAWIAGYTPQYAVAVWVGNRADERPIVDRTGQPVTGATLPAEIYRAVLATALAGTPVVEPGQPAPFGDIGAGNA